MVAWGFQSIEKIQIEWIGISQVRATLDPTFLILFIIGFFVIGSGTAEVGSAIVIYFLEKELFSIKNSRIEQNGVRKFCKYCGTKVDTESAFCSD